MCFFSNLAVLQNLRNKWMKNNHLEKMWKGIELDVQVYFYCMLNTCWNEQMYSCTYQHWLLHTGRETYQAIQCCLFHFTGSWQERSRRKYLTENRAWNFRKSSSDLAKKGHVNHSVTKHPSETTFTKSFSRDILILSIYLWNKQQ